MYRTIIRYVTPRRTAVRLKYRFIPVRPTLECYFTSNQSCASATATRESHLNTLGDSHVISFQLVFSAILWGKILRNVCYCVIA